MNGPAFPLLLALALLFFLFGPIGASVGRGAWSPILLGLSWAVATLFVIVFLRRMRKGARR
ncbi:MAG: hypothetical protein ACRDGW_01780 [Actinomycetota bacterium]